MITFGAVCGKITLYDLTSDSTSFLIKNTKCGEGLCDINNETNLLASVIVKKSNEECVILVCLNSSKAIGQFTLQGLQTQLLKLTEDGRVILVWSINCAKIIAYEVNGIKIWEHEVSGYISIISIVPKNNDLLIWQDDSQLSLYSSNSFSTYSLSFSILFTLCF